MDKHKKKFALNLTCSCIVVDCLGACVCLILPF